MAKSKLKIAEDIKAETASAKQVFTPIKSKYKPIPKFNGKCPNC